MEGSTCPEAAPGGGGREQDRESQRGGFIDSSREAGMQRREIKILKILGHPHPTLLILPPEPGRTDASLVQARSVEWGWEGRREGEGAAGVGGGLWDPSLTLTHISPPESHPAELGDFQRQFLLTSQLSWASGLLIRLVNTTRTRGEQGSPWAPQLPFPLSAAPSPGLPFSVLEHLSLFAASVILPKPGCLCLQVSLPLCLSLSCPSLSLSVLVSREGSRKLSQP